MLYISTSMPSNDSSIILCKKKKKNVRAKGGMVEKSADRISNEVILCNRI